jgi:uncharacterized membrane protein
LNRRADDSLEKHTVLGVNTNVMTGYGWDMGLTGWLWMGIGAVLLIVVVWALIYAVSGRDRRPTEDAAEILRGRFARGEISQAEYEQARKALGL